MKHRLQLTTASLFGLLLAAVSAAAGGEAPAAPRWYRGNTHTHTLNSDGDSPVGTVTHWYRDQGYDFMVISDHRYVTAVAELQREFDRETERLKKTPFLLIAGEEVDGSIYVAGGRRTKTVHCTSVAPRSAAGEQAGDTVAGLAQTIVDAIRATGGRPIINHPNFHWSVTAADILAVRHVHHFELFSGHPSVHSLGGSGRPGTEAIWDAVLSAGRILYGVAADDAHDWREWSRLKSNPGRAWIVVRAAELKPAAILEAFDRGDFYSSTGVELLDVTHKDGTLSIRIKQRGYIPPDQPAKNLFGYTTTFIGRDGRVLKVDESMEPEYTLQPGDLYVRARVVSSAGEVAWTQPLFAPGEGRLD
jgi:hypothetical protein